MNTKWVKLLQKIYRGSWMNTKSTELLRKLQLRTITWLTVRVSWSDIDDVLGVRRVVGRIGDRTTLRVLLMVDVMRSKVWLQFWGRANLTTSTVRVFVGHLAATLLNRRNACAAACLTLTVTHKHKISLVQWGQYSKLIMNEKKEFTDKRTEQRLHHSHCYFGGNVGWLKQCTLRERSNVCLNLA